jgi:hypothetical protein
MTGWLGQSVGSASSRGQQDLSQCLDLEVAPSKLDPVGAVSDWYRRSGRFNGWNEVDHMIRAQISD